MYMIIFIFRREGAKRQYPYLLIQYDKGSTYLGGTIAGSAHLLRPIEATPSKTRHALKLTLFEFDRVVRPHAAQLRAKMLSLDSFDNVEP